MIRLKRSDTKYHNKKTEFDGITFDSAKEGKAYLVLKALQDEGYISELELQPKYELIPSIKEAYTKQLKTKTKQCERTVQLAVTYTADFRFICNGKQVVMDVKASPKMIPPEFRLKAKMMRYFHGINVVCVFKLKELDIFKQPHYGETEEDTTQTE